MKITFLSPVDPQDKQRQSMPVSYMSVEVESADGNTHDVSIYTDVSAEWASGDRSQVAEWSQGVVRGASGDISYHKFWRQLQQEFSENSDQAAWGYWYYATETGNGVTYQSGGHTTVRQQYVENGSLQDSNDTNFRAIDNDFPVFGFSKDLGSVGTKSVETWFTINLLQRNSVQFNSGGGLQPVPAFWTNTHADELSAIAAFYDDYSDATQSTLALDQKVSSDANSVSGRDYGTITTLAVRQAFASVQIAGSESKNYMFLKEISSNGNFQTVDVIFPFHPILLYLNPDWMKLVLDPLFLNMEAEWPQPYAIHDLGDHYPNATGHADGIAALQPLEESGNMLIMTLATAQKTGDTGYIDQHWQILAEWADWLISNNTVIPFNQISTDDFAGPLANQTNLALKGIIGLQAAAMMANMTGRTEASNRYSGTAQDWIKQWEDLAVSKTANPPHTTLNYGADDSYSLLYNMYGDALVQTNIVPRRIYEMQSNFYPSVEQTYGVPLDTRDLRTKNDWEIFCAAIASKDTEAMFLRDIVKFINETPTSGPVTDLYRVNDGTYSPGAAFRARPVVGGWFALLALNQTGIPNGT